MKPRETDIAVTLPNRGVRNAAGHRGGAAIRLRDRSLEFRRAKRHSQVVGVMKVMLPLVAAGVLSLYFMPALLTVSIDGGKGQASVEAISLESGALKMTNPRVAGVHDKQGEYDVRAVSATQEAANPDVLVLDTITGLMTNPGGQVTTLKAPGGVYNSRTEEMTFNSGLEITRTPAMSVKLETAKVYIKEQRVVSETPVEVRLHDSTINSDRLTLFTVDARAVFEGRVKVHLKRQPPEEGGASPKVERDAAANPGMTDPVGESPAPGRAR